ncbi:MAG: SDR family NAD(P)-dependent oxidoreductase [Bacteroidota bacterium]
MNDSVLITGGSSGIGYEISRHFARGGFRILWVAKPEAELIAAAHDLRGEFPTLSLDYLALDLTEEGAPEQVQQWVLEQGGVSVLINNAGIGSYGFLQDTQLEKEKTMIQLNVLAVYQLTRLFLDQMLAAQQGTIINICSISAFYPVPRMNTYAATKAFIQHFSLGLQQELTLQRSPVRVMTVFPAAIRDTPFLVAADMEGVKTFDGLVTTTAEEVARDVWKGFTQGKTKVLTGAKIRWLYAFKWLIPSKLQQWMVTRETVRNTTSHAK